MEHSPPTWVIPFRKRSFLSWELSNDNSSLGRGGTPCPPPFSMLRFCLACACPSLVHAVSAVMDFCVQLSCCAWKTVSCSHPACLLQLSLPQWSLSLKRKRRRRERRRRKKRCRQRTGRQRRGKKRGRKRGRRNGRTEISLSTGSALNQLTFHGSPIITLKSAAMLWSRGALNNYP